jgi:hypothetical protein
MARYGRLLTDAQREKIRPLQDVWLKIWRAFLAELNQRKQLHRSESFLDGSLVPAKKGRWSRKKQAGQGHEMDGGGPIRVSRRTHAGRPRQKPLRLIADRGYDRTRCENSWPCAGSN